MTVSLTSITRFYNLSQVQPIWEPGEFLTVGLPYGIISQLPKLTHSGRMQTRGKSM
jgi:hypothetical protein